jgi:hypothetical protein
MTGLPINPGRNPIAVLYTIDQDRVGLDFSNLMSGNTISLRIHDEHRGACAGPGLCTTGGDRRNASPEWILRTCPSVNLDNLAMT